MSRASEVGNEILDRENGLDYRRKMLQGVEWTGQLYDFMNHGGSVTGGLTETQAGSPTVGGAPFCHRFAPVVARPFSRRLPPVVGALSNR